MIKFIHIHNKIVTGTPSGKWTSVDRKEFITASLAHAKILHENETTDDVMEVCIPSDYI